MTLRLELVVALSILSSMAFVPAKASNATTKTLCTLPILGDIQMAAHAGFCTQYYASRFPQLSWDHKYLVSNEVTAKNFVKNWVLKETGCDFLVGPGYSYLAVALSPLVEIPWVDPSATSTELSDKENHPSFSRVIPTDEVGAKAAAIVYKEFGWNRTNVFCSDESYGRSVANGLTSAIQAQGGEVEVSRCLEASAEGDRVTQAVQAFLNSKTKVVFVAMLPFHKLFIAFREEVKRLNATNDLVFFYSEAMCSASDRTYTQLPGGICATYLADPATIDPFLTAYRARDTTAEMAELQALGFPADADINRTTNIYAVLAHDATLHAMNTVHNYHTSGSTEDIFSYLRKQTTVGASGTIVIETNGDRGVVDGVVYNSQPGQKEKVIATIKEGTFQYTDEKTIPVTTRPELYFLTTTVTSSDRIPDIAIQDDGAGSSSAATDPTGMIIAIVFGSLFFILLAAAVPALLVVKKSNTRDVANAPTDPEKPFTIIFTDIQGSTNLWARVPEQMADAVEAHHTLIRKLLGEHKGYEVKTIGDSFMCAFKSVEDGVNFANSLQSTFLRHDWGDDNAIEEMYKELLAEANIDQITQGFDGNGLRVRVGVHYGEGNVILDEVTKAYDYYGTVVNTAARVEAIGHGGQTLVTDPVIAALSSSLKSSLLVSDLGPQALRGLDEGIRIHQVCVKTETDLTRRKFPPLRLEKAEDVEVGEESSQHSAKSRLSVASKMSTGPALEIMALKYAKRGGFAGDPTMVDRLLDLQAYTRVLFSTSDKVYREKAVKHLCTKWRVPVGAATGQKDMKTDLSYQATLLEIASRVMNISDAQSRTKKHLDGTFRRSSRRGSKFGAFLGGSSNHSPEHDSIHEFEGSLGHSNQLIGTVGPGHNNNSSAAGLSPRQLPESGDEDETPKDGGGRGDKDKPQPAPVEIMVEDVGTPEPGH